MKRQTMVTIRVSREEHAGIVKLARLLQRSKSDAIRYVVLLELRRLEHKPINPAVQEDFGRRPVSQKSAV